MRWQRHNSVNCGVSAVREVGSQPEQASNVCPDSAATTYAAFSPATCAKPVRDRLSDQFPHILSKNAGHDIVFI